MITTLTVRPSIFSCLARGAIRALASCVAFVVAAALPSSALADDPCGIATNSCLEVNLKGGGCNSVQCCQAVCTIEPACCDVAWDELCVALAFKVCDVCGTASTSCLVAAPTPGCGEPSCCSSVCSSPGFEYCCEVAWDANCAAAAMVLCQGCAAPGAGPCNAVHETKGCADADCCAKVCTVDPSCCTVTWDETCVEWAAIFCPGCGSPVVGSCCFEHDGPFCDDLDCCTAICDIDPYCCDVRWDGTCVQLANAQCNLPNCNCGDAGAGSCKTPHQTPGCNDFTCCNIVCVIDAYCCVVAWDYTCTILAGQNCTTLPNCGDVGKGSCFAKHSTPGCDEDGCCQIVCLTDPTCCQVAWDADCVTLAMAICTGCGDLQSGSCFAAHGDPACADLQCCQNVCLVDSFCCAEEWDSVCVKLAFALCNPPTNNCGVPTGRSCFVPSFLPGCDDAGCCFEICTTVDPFCCEVSWDAACVDLALTYCGAHSGCPGRGSCAAPHSFTGCNDPICCSAVCDIDPYCCSLTWDQNCANFAKGICFGLLECPGEKPCNKSHIEPGCDDPSCCNVVCTADPVCCVEKWDAACVALAALHCQPDAGSHCPCFGSCIEAHLNPGCEDPSCCAGVCELDPNCCAVLWDEVCAGLARGICCGSVGCGNWCAGSCFESHAQPFCDSASCCEAVCSIDPFCCESKWDAGCASLADDRCSKLCGVADSGSCFAAKATPACSDRACCDLVCNADPVCCASAWDSACAMMAGGDPNARPPKAGICKLPKCGEFIAGRCCEEHDTPACDNQACCNAICSADPFCCDTQWDATCVAAARRNPICNCVSDCGDDCAGSCCVPHDTPLCDDAACCTAVCTVDPFCCDLGSGQWDVLCAASAFSTSDCNVACPPPPCGDPAAGDCCTPHSLPNCDDARCCNDVCNQDAFCCSNEWDFACAVAAGNLCRLCQSKLFCGSSAAGDCFAQHSTPFCNDLNCCSTVCTFDETCCAIEWDAECANLAQQFCGVF